MRNFPKKFFVHIFGLKTKVIVTKDLVLNHGAMGLFSRQKNQILIAQDQTKDEAIQTLLHECGHALFSRVGTNQAISHELEEIIVEQYSIMIHENFNLSLKKRR